MSAEVVDGTTPFTMVPHWLLGAVSPRAVVVYVALGSFADNRTRRARPSVASIAERAGCGETVAREAIRELERVGAIKVERTDGGVKQTNRYVLDAMNQKTPRSNPSESRGRNPSESRGRNPSESRGGTRLIELEADSSLRSSSVADTATPSPEAIAATQTFENVTAQIGHRGFSWRQRKNWPDEFDRMHAEDGRTWDEINGAINWLPSDDYYAAHITTPRKLRQAFVAMRAAATKRTRGGKMQRANAVSDAIDGLTPDEVLEKLSGLGSLVADTKEIGK